MKKTFKTVENNEIKEYEILLEFTSNENKKNYVFYKDKLKNEINIAYYELKDKLYILMPIIDEKEKEMCKNILEDIKNFK